jgi:hypothetical protein
MDKIDFPNNEIFFSCGMSEIANNKRQLMPAAKGTK